MRPSWPKFQPNATTLSLIHARHQIPLLVLGHVNRPKQGVAAGLLFAADLLGEQALGFYLQALNSQTLMQFQPAVDLRSGTSCLIVLVFWVQQPVHSGWVRPMISGIWLMLWPVSPSIREPACDRDGLGASPKPPPPSHSHASSTWRFA